METLSRQACRVVTSWFRKLLLFPGVLACFYALCRWVNAEKSYSSPWPGERFVLAVISLPFPSKNKYTK
jgi:hypothetical protein